MSHAVPVLLLALGAFAPLYFVSRAVHFGPRSRRLINLALACGLSGCFLPEISWFDPESDGRMLRIAAVVRFALIGVGLLLILFAILARRDGGLGLSRPVFAVTVGLLHLLVGMVEWSIGTYMAPSPSWVYTAPDDAFRVYLPNARWRPTVSPDGGTAFACLLPPMRVTVRHRMDQTRADYLLSQQVLWDRVRGEAAPGEQVTRGEGATTSGRDFVSFQTLASERGQTVFVARALVLNPARRTLLEVHFEGPIRSRDPSGRDRERRTVERLAEQFVQTTE